MIKVTAAFNEHQVPIPLAPSDAAMSVPARIFPRISLFAPMAAEVPSTKNTLQACAPPTSKTLLPAALLKVVLIWKINWPLGFPVPSSVTVVVKVAEGVGKV